MHKHVHNMLINIFFFNNSSNKRLKYLFDLSETPFGKSFKTHSYTTFSYKHS